MIYSIKTYRVECGVSAIYFNNARVPIYLLIGLILFDDFLFFNKYLRKYI